MSDKTIDDFVLNMRRVQLSDPRISIYVAEDLKLQTIMVDPEAYVEIIGVKYNDCRLYTLKKTLKK